jgi:hypothetical protein
VVLKFGPDCTTVPLHIEVPVQEKSIPALVAIAGCAINGRSSKAAEPKSTHLSGDFDLNVASLRIVSPQTRELARRT